MNKHKEIDFLIAIGGAITGWITAKGFGCVNIGFFVVAGAYSGLMLSWLFIHKTTHQKILLYTLCYVIGVLLLNIWWNYKYNQSFWAN